MNPAYLRLAEALNTGGAILFNIRKRICPRVGDELNLAGVINRSRLAKRVLKPSAGTKVRVVSRRVGYEYHAAIIRRNHAQVRNNYDLIARRFWLKKEALQGATAEGREITI